MLVNKLPPLHVNSNGSTIAFLMAMVAFIGALAWSFTGTAKEYIDGVYSIRRSSGRSFSLSQIQIMLATTKSLSESSRYLPSNESLRVCLEGGAQGACLENCCQGNIAQGFYFKDPLDTTAQIDAKRDISAPPGSPVYYKLDGSPCLNASSTTNSCAYSLVSTFTAHCPGGVSNCDHAEHLRISVLMVPMENYPQIKEKELVSYYFPHVNYPPAIPNIGDQSLTVGVPQTLPFTADSGHPSEIQNFKFEICQSANEAILKVTCQAFSGGVGQIILEPLSAGNTTITLQINDGGLTNYLSKPYTFNSAVSP